MMASPAVLWPYRFDAQPVLRATINAVSEDITLLTAAGTDYYVSGDGTSTDLLALLEAALEAHSEAPNVHSSILSTFQVRFALGAVTTLQWSHANTTLDATIFGWLDGVDSSSLATLTSPNEPGGLWRPGKPAETDTGDVSAVVGGAAVSLSGLQRTSYFAAPFAARDLGFSLVLPERAETRYALSTAPLGAYESGWLASLSRGWVLRYAPDETALGTATDYVLRAPSTRSIERDDRFPAQRYRVQLALRRTT